MSVVQTLIGNVKGPQGATGATGQTGAQGPAATITVGSTTTTAYGNSAQVTNVGTSSAAVLDFVIPQGKPGEATTKMGDLVLDAITTSAADFPSPQVDDTGKVAFGKIVKFFSDVLSRFTKHAGDIATVSASPTTQNFTAGEYLINNDQLYKVTSNISSGGTITPGTNVSSTSVGAQLKSLNDSLAGIGAFYYDSANTSVSANTWTTGKTLEIPAGTYLQIHQAFSTTGKIRCGYTSSTGNWVESNGAYDLAQTIVVATYQTTTTIGNHLYTQNAGTYTNAITAIRIK